MPVLPEFENDVRVGVPQVPLANPEAFGKAGEALARGAGEVTDNLAQFNQRLIEAKRATMAADTMVSAQQQLGAAANKWELVPDRQKASDGFNTDAAAIRKQLVDPITDPFAKGLVTDQFDKAVIYHSSSVSTEALHREIGVSNGNLDLQLNDLAHQYANAGNGIGADYERAQIKDIASMAVNGRVASGYLEGEEGAHKLIGFSSRVDYADAVRDIDIDPHAAFDKLNGATAYPNLDELTRSRLIARADNKMQGRDASLRGDVSARFEDNVASIEQTGEAASPLSPDEIRKAYPERADAMIGRLALAGNLYRARNSIALTSVQDDQALLGKWTPKGEGFADQEKAYGALQSSLTQKYDALNKDPAAYVLQASPDIAAKFDAAQKDPRQLGAAVGALNAAYDKIGVPQAMRNVLPAQSAQGLAQSIEANPEQAPATIKAMAQQYGSAWPQAWHDLTTAGKLPAAYQAVASLDNQGDGALLARWLGQASQGKKADDILGDKAVSAIKNSVRSDPNVQAYLASLSRSGASINQVSSVTDAIDSLAFARSYFNRDPLAAQNAISSFTGKYEFMPNGGARVPRDRFDDVSARASQTLNGLALDKLAVPGVYGQQGMPKPQEFLDLLKASPMWINSPRSDALWLMDPYGRLVRDKKGAPVAVPLNAGPQP